MDARALANLFFRRPRLSVLTLALIVVAGLSSLHTLPRAEDPHLTARFGMVFTRYPGAGAARVEALVTERIETAMREIEEVSSVISNSRAGISTVVIELEDRVSGAAADPVWSVVRDRLSDVERELPAAAGRPVFEKVSNAAWTMLLGLRWELDGEPDRVILSRLADDLADVLRGARGTEKVAVYGAPEEEVTVEVDPARLAASGLSVDDVAAAVRRADAKDPAGRVHGDGNELLVEVSGALDSLQRIRDLPVRAGAGGRFLRLADLGTIRKRSAQPDRSLALISGAPGVVVAGRVDAAQRVDAWAGAIRGRMAEFVAGLPRGVALVTLFDQGRYTERRLSGLFGSFLAGLGLVTLVVLIAMGWRAAVLVGAALPVTTLMVLSGMSALGVPLDQMSVTGLIIALGLLIDNAIVMVDEVRRRLAEGMAVRDAVAEGARHLAVPLLGSTVTTILAFMPIALMPGQAGEFVASIAKTVVLALCSSLFLALTLVPAFSGMLHGRAARPGWFEDGVGHRGLTAAYRSALLWMCGRPAAGLGIACCLPVLGFAAFGRLEEQFFPAADRDQAAVEIQLPRHASIERTRRDAVAVREEMRKHPLVEDVHWFLGESAPKFYYNFAESRRYQGFYAQGLVQLKTSEGSFAAIRALQATLEERFPSQQVLVKQLEQGPPFDAPVELRVFGHDLDALRRVGEELRAELAAVPGVTHTRAKLLGGQPKVRVELDEEQARRAGFDNAAVAGYLEAGLDGRRGGSMVEGTEDLPVRVRARASDRSDVAGIRSFDLPGASGATPLAAVGRLRLEADAAALPHHDGRRCNTVQGFLDAGMLPSRALAELQRRLEAKGFALPAGVTLELGGEAAERDEAVQTLLAAGLVLLVLMVGSLVLAFDSFRMAGVIAAVAGLSVALPALGLFVLGYPFGFMAIVGTMGLIGVAVNDSIVVLAALRESELARAGDHEEVVRIVMRATRHLLATTLTTVAGFVPLVLAGGGFWPPVAVAIGGGVAGATLLAVTLVPALFLLAHRPRSAPARG